MINDLFRTYKKIILLLLVLLCSVVFWFYGSALFADAAPLFCCSVVRVK